MEEPADTIISVDSGGTYYKSALVDPDGNIIPGSFLELPSYSEEPKEKVIFAFKEVLLKMIEQADLNKRCISRIVFSFPGPFDYQRGACMMKHKFVSVYDLPLKPIVQEIINDSRLKVTFHNDMHAFAWGAYKFDAGQGFSNVFCVAIGTGLGGACVYKGKIIMREDRGAMFPIFRQPYKDGILEDFVSNRGLVNEYRRLTGFNGDLDARKITQFAENNDEAALEVYRNMGFILGKELKPLFDEWDIKCLVLGGQIAKGYHFFGPALAEALANSKTIQFIGPLKDSAYVSIRGNAALPIPDDT